ncbi:hypothetical protein ABIQ69_11390 [Agromyces sp. G08B096]|uniref:Helix-turn-helix DNA binding domain protein n=1 Tax=Agromyces sp. G08B096 TaxID=3156399 RepID=A0AAU7W452_9MICO
MARRIRTVKPEFWESEDVARLPKLARLTMLGLFNYADDYGRFKANPALIKAAVWPLDDDVTADDVHDHLTHMNEGGQIVSYEVEGRGYYVFAKWAEHQKVDRPSKSSIPAPAGSDDARESSRASREDSSQEGKGREGNREGDARGATPPSEFCPKHPTGTTQKCGPCGDARRARKAWDAAQKAKPSARPPRKGECRHRFVGGYCAECSIKEAA